MLDWSIWTIEFRRLDCHIEDLELVAAQMVRQPRRWLVLRVL